MSENAPLVTPEEQAREARESVILLLAFPGRMREPMAEDLLALCDFLSEDDGESARGQEGWERR